MEYILELLGTLVIKTIETTGYAGIVFLMALESANIPIPSEIIMPFSGYLVWEEKLDFYSVVFWGAVGNLMGSLVSYYLGFFGGRPFFTTYGKFLLISHHDLELADKWFQKYGNFIIFASRIVPVVRTFISFPAGVAKMNVWLFFLYTFLGSLLWSVVLTYAGLIAGENWNLLQVYFRRFDWLIIGIGVLLVIWWVWRHFKEISKPKIQIPK